MVEHACGLASLQIGEFVSNISSGIDTYTIREPLGVCAGICSFEFPAMIPLWVSLLNYCLLLPALLIWTTGSFKVSDMSPSPLYLQLRNKE